MIRLTLFEHALRRALVAKARAGWVGDPSASRVTYTGLADEIDPDHASRYPMTRPPFRGLDVALGHVCIYEVEHGRPMLTALVVQQEAGIPGEGFFKLARRLGKEVGDEVEFWRAELAAALDFWSDLDPTRPIDAALERIVDELVTIKDRLRRL